MVEWDEDKRQKTLRKHKLDFVDAKQVLEDPERLEQQSNRRHTSEMRYGVFGHCNGRLCFVAYTWRGIEKRVFCFRKANKDEQKAYKQARAEREKLHHR